MGEKTMRNIMNTGLGLSVEPRGSMTKKIGLLTGAIAIATLGLVGSRAARATNEGGSTGGNVEVSNGSFSTSVPIAMPGFHGIEPAIGLSYTAAGSTSFAGVGWSLSGFATVERASPNEGGPNYDTTDANLLSATDIFLLN